MAKEATISTNQHSSVHFLLLLLAHPRKSTGQQNFINCWTTFN